MTWETDHVRVIYVTWPGRQNTLALFTSCDLGDRTGLSYLRHLTWKTEHFSVIYTTWLGGKYLRAIYVTKPEIQEVSELFTSSDPVDRTLQTCSCHQTWNMKHFNINYVTKRGRQIISELFMSSNLKEGILQCQTLHNTWKTEQFWLAYMPRPGRQSISGSHRQTWEVENLRFQFCHQTQGI